MEARVQYRFAQEQVAQNVRERLETRSERLWLIREGFEKALLILLAEYAYDESFQAGSCHPFGMQDDQASHCGRVEQSRQKVYDEDSGSDGTYPSALIHSLALRHIRHVRVHQLHTTALCTARNGSMFSQRLAHPVILPILSADEDDKVVTRGIVRVQEIGDEAEEAQSPGEYEQLVFGAERVEDVLLEVERERKAARGGPKRCRCQRRCARPLQRMGRGRERRAAEADMEKTTVTWMRAALACQGKRVKARRTRTR